MFPSFVTSSLRFVLAESSSFPGFAGSAVELASSFVFVAQLGASEHGLGFEAPLDVDSVVPLGVEGIGTDGLSVVVERIAFDLAWNLVLSLVDVIVLVFHNCLVFGVLGLHVHIGVLLVLIH